MKFVLQADGAADINASSDTTNYTVEAPLAGVLRLDECFLRWTEATGSQTTTQGVISIEVASVEVATLTANQSDGIGQTQLFTASGDEYIEFAAGDVIAVLTKTQAVDGTVTGDGTCMLSLELGV